MPAETDGQPGINSNATANNLANLPPTSQTNLATASSSNPTQLFGELDRGSKGYLSQPDVAANQFLSGNFQNCDVSGDGRLTQDEVTACMRNTSRQ